MSHEPSDPTAAVPAPEPSACRCAHEKDLPSFGKVRCCTLARCCCAPAVPAVDRGAARERRDEIRAEDAERRGQGICRTCLAPIWNEGGTVGGRHQDTGWSDRIERGGDSLVCFKAVEYRHVPLTGREACIYDRALRVSAAEVEALEAENQRLREALTEITRYSGNPHDVNQRKINALALAALGGV